MAARKNPTRSVINTTGETVDASAPTEPSPTTTSPSPKGEAKKGRSKKGSDKDEKNEKSEEDETPIERGEPSQAVLEATAAMARAAAKDGETALATADQFDREVLLDTIAFQLPAAWITKSVVDRLKTIDTPALALVISWLAANWWAGYENGQSETLTSIRTATEKGLRGATEKGVLESVEKQINEDRERVAHEEGKKS